MTPEQLAILKAAILAETDAGFVAARTAGATGTMSAFYNEMAVPAFVVWHSNAAIADVYNAIDWKNLTPADAPSSTTTFTNIALACQARQINLQIMLQGQARIDGTKVNVRTGLKDALEGVPSGVAGATKDAGWPAVKAAITRSVTRGERLFATGTGTAGTPGLATFEGNISGDDVATALGG